MGKKLMWHAITYRHFNAFSVSHQIKMIDFDGTQEILQNKRITKRRQRCNAADDSPRPRTDVQSLAIHHIQCDPAASAHNTQHIVKHTHT